MIIAPRAAERMTGSQGPKSRLKTIVGKLLAQRRLASPQWQLVSRRMGAGSPGRWRGDGLSVTPSTSAQGRT